jgi:hypothetical protein
MKQQLIEALQTVLANITEEQAQVIIEARAKKYGRQETIPSYEEKEVDGLFVREPIAIENPEPKHIFFMRSIFEQFNNDGIEYVNAKAQQEAEAEVARLAKEKADDAFTPVEI